MTAVALIAIFVAAPICLANACHEAGRRRAR